MSDKPDMEAVNALAIQRIEERRRERMRASSLPPAFAQRIGAAPPPKGESALEPSTMLDHALRWADRGLSIFPCQRFLGRPIVTGTAKTTWYTEATGNRSAIVSWWSATPDADIAAVPEMSGHFVLIATGERGRDSLYALEDEHGDLGGEFEYENAWGDLHLWFKGSALTSHNVIGKGLHIIGAGNFVYLAPSFAPDPLWT